MRFGRWGVAMNDHRAPMASAASCTDGNLEASNENLGDSHSLSLFLNSLAADIKRQPEMLQAMDSRLVERINLLLLGVEVELDAPLQAEDE